MTNVIVASSKLKDAKSIKNILMRNGFSIVVVCTSGAQTLNCMGGLNGGILVSGHWFEDMLYRELRECLPVRFKMLLVAFPARLSGGLLGGSVYLPMPLKVHDLINTLEMMTQAQTKRKRKDRQKPRERNKEERQLIIRAKELLVERGNMAGTEAHRYIQRCSMDNGTNMVGTAQMVMSLIHLWNIVYGHEIQGKNREKSKWNLRKYIELAMIMSI